MNALSPLAAFYKGNQEHASARLAALHDKRNYSMDGLDLLQAIPSGSIPYVIFDPQYDHLLQFMKYGNTDGNGRQKGRRALPPQSAMDLWRFGQQIVRILKPSGHVSLWMDTYILCETDPLEIFTDDAGHTDMHRVDLITWDKVRMGMGARSRHQAEFLMTFQKSPKRAKGCWNSHSIRDVWQEAVTKTHPHSKPVGLQAALIEALTKPGDVVVDPTAGGFSTMTAAHQVGRRFLGCEYLAENDPALQP
ncbi:MAG: DNA methyltransferase [Xanthobacteraceae bacterium]|jgi:site-specific DNA-methyltransferase (adenine-specific)